MKKIVLSGSMRIREEIIECGNQLQDMGYNVVIPRECIDINLEKAAASRLHFDEILKEDVDAILVINGNKENKNYIGANTFAEIAIAWYFNKKVFLLNDIYKPCREELVAWKVTPLNGKLEDIGT